MKLTKIATAKIETATAKQLVAFYNTHTDKPITKFSGIVVGQERVTKLVSDLVYNYMVCPHCLDLNDPATWTADNSITPAGVEGTKDAERTECHSCGTVYKANGDVYKPRKSTEPKTVSEGFSQTMSTSLKLDRTVRHVETGETYKNCFRLFTEAKLLTNAQSDKLSGILYKEAKQGIKVTFSFGEGLTFELVNVPGAK